MDAQLMSASGLGFKFEPGDWHAAPCPPSLDAPKRHPLLAFRVDLLPPADLVIQAAKRQIDCSLFALRRVGDNRPIGLCDLALLEQAPQCFQGLVMPSEHEAAGGARVEPMRKRRPSRQAEAQGVKVVLEARAAFRPGVNGDAGGLIENEHHPVAIEEPRSCFFRRHGKKWYGSIGRAGIVRREGFVGLDEDDDKKGKSGLMRRWFGGGDAATAPDLPPPPVVSETEPPATQEAEPLAEARAPPSVAAAPDDLEGVLIQADLGLAAASRIREAVGHGRYERGINPDEVKQILADEVERALEPVARPLVIDPDKRPFVILVIGVNGSGKTTTIGKLAAKFRAEGKAVLLAAGDTFRAAAIEQLRIWARRTLSALVERDQGADAAGLAFEALTRARELNVDVMIMDTAGRLQNRTELMSELEKIIRVMRKVDAEAPHAVLLVLDATVGQNALSQVEIFGRVAGVTGLVMTKLDGTARGGILVAIADKFALPVHFIGVGEGVDDLEPFTARDFADAIAGIDREAA